MKKEGLKYILFSISLVILLVTGVILVRPFPWLGAEQAKITGQFIFPGDEYKFSGVTINQIRNLDGKAISKNTTNEICFDCEGAEVSVDQIGFLRGQAWGGEDLGWIEFDLTDGYKVKIDDNGVLSGETKTKDGQTIKVSGTTDWRPYELAEINVDDKVRANVSAKTRIDPVVTGIGGRELNDVEMKWVSNNQFVAVDKYGYVSVEQPGEYPNAVILQVGNSQKEVTILASEDIKLKMVSPAVVMMKPDQQNFKFEFTGVANNNSVKIGLTKDGAGECVRTTSIVGGIASMNCAVNAQGAWNVTLKVGDSDYFYPNRVFAVGENTLNVYISTNIAGSEEPNALSKGSTLNYNLALDWPDWIGDISTYKVTSSNAVLNKVGYCPDFPSKSLSVPGIGGASNIALPSDVIASKMASVTEYKNEHFYTENYNVDYKAPPAGLPEGCDLESTFEVIISLQNPANPAETLNLKGKGVVRNTIRSRKAILLEGSALVEDGSLQIKKLDTSNQNTGQNYVIGAKDQVKIDSSNNENGAGRQNKNQLEGYTYDVGDGTTEEKGFDEAVTKIRQKVLGLMAEFSDDSINCSLGTIDNAKLSQWETYWKSSGREITPEGVIVYCPGNMVLGTVASNTMNIGIPLTIVVDGNVDVKSPITMSGEGNFGLIVLDGDISFAGDIKETKGYYFTTGTIKTGMSHDIFRLRGIAIAHDFELQRI